MHCRSTELASQLTVEPDKLLESMPLADIDIPDSAKALLDNSSPDIQRLKTLDLASFAKDSAITDFVNWGTDTVPPKIKQKMEADKEIVDRMSQYFIQITGLEDLLAKDNAYCKARQRLDRLRPLIPTKEISLAVSTYIKGSRLSSSMLAILKSTNQAFASEIMRTIFPLKIIVDASRGPTVIDDSMTTMLAEVRESIEKYYAGKG